MKRYTIDLANKRYVVDVQDIGNGTFRVLVGDRWYEASVSQGREVGSDWGESVNRVANVPPVINIAMPQQPAPVFNMPAPVINVQVPKQAAPVVNVAAPPAPVVNVPQQAAPVVNVAAPIVNVPQQERQAPPVINVQMPEQAPPVVNIEPAAVNVNIPDIKINAASVSKVKRDYTGKITEITSNAEAVSGGVEG